MIIPSENYASVIQITDTLNRHSTGTFFLEVLRASVPFVRVCGGGGGSGIVGHVATVALRDRRRATADRYISLSATRVRGMVPKPSIDRVSKVSCSALTTQVTPPARTEALVRALLGHF